MKDKSGKIFHKKDKIQQRKKGYSEVQYSHLQSQAKAANGSIPMTYNNTGFLLLSMAN